MQLRADQYLLRSPEYAPPEQKGRPRYETKKRAHKAMAHWWHRSNMTSFSWEVIEIEDGFIAKIYEGNYCSFELPLDASFGIIGKEEKLYPHEFHYSTGYGDEYLIKVEIEKELNKSTIVIAENGLKILTPDSCLEDDMTLRTAFFMTAHNAQVANPDHPYSFLYHEK